MRPVSVKRCSSLLGRVPPAAWFFALLLGGWGLDRLAPLPIPFPSVAWQLCPALILFVAAALFAASAVGRFFAQDTSLLPFSQASALLTTGPFRLSRNPLYVSLVATLLAFGLLLASVWFVLLAFVLLGALNRFVIPGEEAALLRTFGPAYTAYSRRVRRWL